MPDTDEGISKMGSINENDVLEWLGSDDYKKKENNGHTEFQWKIVYILIPLLPFLVGGFIRFLFMLANGCIVFETFYSSWDAVNLSFSVSIITFFVRNNLMENPPVEYKNEPFRKHINPISKFSNDSIILLLLGISNLIFFGCLIIIHTLYRDLKSSDLENAYFLFSIITWFFCIVSILYIIDTQKQYKLIAKLS